MYNGDVMIDKYYYISYLIMNIMGHTAPINYITMNKKFIATSSPKEIVIWDRSTLVELFVFKEYKSTSQTGLTLFGNEFMASDRSSNIIGYDPI